LPLKGTCACVPIGFELSKVSLRSIGAPGSHRTDGDLDPPGAGPLRFNLFGAWMVVLIAEATGVGFDLGQVIMMARACAAARPPPATLFHGSAGLSVLGWVT
jgi:hypothetical protein